MSVTSCMALCAFAGCSGDISVSQTATTASSAAETVITTAANEETDALKGWWTREGIFYDGVNLVTISFRSTDDGYEESTWFASGVFGDDRFWSGKAELTEEGLAGTVETGTADESFLSEESRGTAQVMIYEEGEYSIMLLYGNGEEYHLTLLTELEP